MSQKHLAEGSEFPPLTDKLRVYSMLYCPYAQRTRLVLEAKSIDYETVNIDLSKKPQWYLNLNPAGLVPCLHLGEGKLIPESLITAEYLDQAYPENKLTPSDPYTNAQHKLIVEGFSKVITAFYKFVRKTDPDADKLLADALEVAVEKKLFDNYFGGENPAMVDYMIWPWLERLDYLQLHHGLSLDESRLPKLLNYIKRMKDVPAVKATIITPEKYKRFFEGYLTGKPVYDFED